MLYGFIDKIFLSVELFTIEIIDIYVLTFMIEIRYIPIYPILMSIIILFTCKIFIVCKSCLGPHDTSLPVVGTIVR